jgi:hypothetical protein
MNQRPLTCHLPLAAEAERSAAYAKERILEQ